MHYPKANADQREGKRKVVSHEKGFPQTGDNTHDGLENNESHHNPKVFRMPRFQLIHTCAP
jgi:hypothetical protein